MRFPNRQSQNKIEGFHTHDTPVSVDFSHEQKKEHKEHNDDHSSGDHDHSHAGVFGEKTELIFAVICGLALGAGFGLSFIINSSPAVSLGFYIGAYFFGGFYTSKEAIQGIIKGEFEIDFLMIVAAIGAAVLGQWAEGALLLFLFSLGHSLEHYAMERQKSLSQL